MTETQKLTDAQVKHMVERFLCWRLPEGFSPDAGISFEPEFNVEWNAKQGRLPQRHEPTGTNLFDYTQAEAMVRHMIDGLPDTRPSPSESMVEAFEELCASVEREEELNGSISSTLMSDVRQARAALKLEATDKEVG